MQRNLLITSVLMVAMNSMLLGEQGAGAQDELTCPAGTPDTRERSSIPAGTSAQIAYRDPATGQFIAPPKIPSKLMQGVFINGLSTRVDDLVSTPSPVPGGGVVLDLKGRFMNLMIAPVKDGGAASAQCIDGHSTAAANITIGPKAQQVTTKPDSMSPLSEQVCDE